MPAPYYITTAIDYTNGPPHIGHAYEKVLADALARYHRLAGDPTYFLTGVDQHGQKVAQSAENEGIQPKEFADRITTKFLSLWETLDVRFDDFAATTDPRHHAVVQKILSDLHDKGQLYKAQHQGFYSVRQEQFLTDKERGEDGNFGTEWGEVIEIAEENWYFKLSEHKEWLLGFLESTPDFITPAFRLKELRNAVERIEGDLCISRPKSRLSWGIELPFDRDFVTYVWFDALINYISFAGYRAEESFDFPKFDQWWPCNAHVIGKDIMVPAHGVYWPIMLHAMGFEDAQMPKLLVHGWWNIAGAKMSKSQGNIVDPAELAEKYGSEAVRYYLLRDIATGRDADFSEDRLRQRYNSDLANDLGNLLNRSLNMSVRYSDGVLTAGTFSDASITALAELRASTATAYTAHMEAADVHAALESIWGLVSHCNGFVEHHAPWKLAKQDADRPQLNAVLYQLAETLRQIAVLVSPALPQSALKIGEQLNWTLPTKTTLTDLLAQSLAEGHTVEKPTPLFPRLETEE